MSRSLGDLLGYYDAGLSSEPDLSSHELKTRIEEIDGLVVDAPPTPSAGSEEPGISSIKLDPAVDSFMLLCSDGVWEFLSSQKAVDICAKYPASQAMKAAESLSKAAWDAWVNAMSGAVVDDITALVIFLGRSDGVTDT